MTDGLLIVIAVATVVVAVIQVSAVVFALRAAKELGGTLQRLQRDLQPVLVNLRTASSDIARATSAAASRVERAEQRLGELSRSVDGAAATLQGYMSSPITNGLALIQGVRAAFGVLREFRRPSPRAQPEAAANHDDMFIG